MGPEASIGARQGHGANPSSAHSPKAHPTIVLHLQTPFNLGEWNGSNGPTPTPHSCPRRDAGSVTSVGEDLGWTEEGSKHNPSSNKKKNGASPAHSGQCGVWEWEGGPGQVLITGSEPGRPNLTHCLS